MEKSIKKVPSLPQDVAKQYEATIIPTVVMIASGKSKGSYDLTRISMEDAEKLANDGKYLKKKSPENSSKAENIKG
jgi:hypothetical protein